MDSTAPTTTRPALDEGRLDLFLKASWGFGGLGTTSMLYLINMFVVFFLVRHVGVPAAVAGALLAVTRVYDAIVDPLIGTLSDRSQGRWGRRRPWMLVGACMPPCSPRCCSIAPATRRSASRTWRRAPR
jgi:GPH family glycoside/pentoside/hexuronide:cation symporter